MVNPVFINPEELGIQDSMKVQPIDNGPIDDNGCVGEVERLSI